MEKRLEILIYNRSKQKIPPEDFFRKILSLFLKKLKEKNRVEISLIFISPQQIKKLNSFWRKKNKPTSVLSFPSQFHKFFNKKYRSKLFFKIKDLGEIIFCPEIIKNQAKKENLKIEYLYKRLLAHSLLHLYGFSHSQKSDFLKMFKLEKILLENKLIKS